jgi:hypothetical protein
MKSAFWRALAVAAIVAMPTLVLANDATIGSEAATSSMAGSTLNNTTALFNAWPHLVTAYGNGAELSTSDFSGTPNNGMGRVWWEAYDELWLNLNVGRSDLGMQSAGFLWGGVVTAPYGAVLGNMGNQLANYDAPTNPWINVGIAKPGANGSAWSANAFFASNSLKNEAANPNTTDSATGFGALVSWGNGSGLNTSAEFRMTTETDETTDPDLEGTSMSFAFNGRYDTDLYLYQGSVAFASGTTQQVNGTAATDFDASFLGVLVNAGRFIKNEVDGQTSIEFVGAFAKTSVDGGPVTAVVSQDATYMVIPGVRVASWEKLTDRFGVMGGVQSIYVLNAQDKVSSGRSLTYDWTAGLFAQATQNVRIDFQFNKASLNQVLSLGNQQPLIAYLGATVSLN